LGAILDPGAYRTGAVKIGKNDADFQDFLSFIDSSGITDRSPDNLHHTRHNIKCLLNLDIQDDFCDTLSHRKQVLILLFGSFV